MAKGLVYARDGWVWFLEGGICAAVPPGAAKAAIRVAEFGQGATPDVAAILEPLRQAVAAAPADEKPCLVHEIEGKMERRSVAKIPGSTIRAQAVFFVIVHALRPCPPR